jgi:isopentenyldiphosphate isomerase
VQQNDPFELLEVLDASGLPTGRAKSRAAIHLDGDWHKAFHCWIVRGPAEEREIVLQRRSLLKDTFAGCWDAAAAGHWRFGESAEAAAREIAEELGLAVGFDALRFRGVERVEHRFENGLVDREWHHVYVLECDLPLAAYRPDPSEVINLAAVRLSELLELVAGRRAELEAVEALSGAVSIGRADLVPYSIARLRRLVG